MDSPFLGDYFGVGPRLGSFSLVPFCGAITQGTSGRQRCMEPDITHRGPHFKNVETITCDCKHFCHCPEKYL